MKKLLLAITVLFTLLLGGCGEKLEPYEYLAPNEDGSITYIFKGTKKDGKKHGIETTIIEETNTIKFIQKYKDGELDGTCKSFYENGNIYQESHWKNGKLDGIATEYDRDGNILHKFWYKDHKLIKSIEYDKKGNVIKETDYTKQ